MIICWTVENNKLYFGKVTRRSWHRAIRGKCGYMLEVKPLKHFETYNYFSDRSVWMDLDRANLINAFLTDIPTTLCYYLSKKGYKVYIDTNENMGADQSAPFDFYKNIYYNINVKRNQIETQGGHAV